MACAYPQSRHTLACSEHTNFQDKSLTLLYSHSFTVLAITGMCPFSIPAHAGKQSQMKISTKTATGIGITQLQCVLLRHNIAHSVPLHMLACPTETCRERTATGIQKPYLQCKCSTMLLIQRPCTYWHAPKMSCTKKQRSKSLQAMSPI